MITLSTENWRARANCRGEDPEHMQPEVATAAEIEEAMRFCVGCPVFDQCKALAHSQPGGAYGIHAGQWYGQKPANLGTLPCGWCGEGFPPRWDGKGRQYCSEKCRKRAARARARADALSA